MGIDLTLKFSEEYMLKKTAVVSSFLFFLLAVFAAGQPSTYKLQREVTIKAPPEKVMALINDLHNWALWAPWEGDDSQLSRTFIGAELGKGAAYLWQDKEERSSGRIEITDSFHPSRVFVDFDFLQPEQIHSSAEFTLVSFGNSTKVVWQMRGPTSFWTKLKGLFGRREHPLGGSFESGLARMKAVAEK
ncbi:SRPBCC family protein [Janthinobacterium fluminis]|uniref:SRPBCC family protein n=1 Tax=Janthinobacterium fluminis TaxID=2987524 RepID=A0ABT5JVR2_9BURK|nr:SRPBCC family protein [Janthinobacterium fluminis]MDC8756804.1 SRPBCC family protein [Janthinobacterium fluminis]